MVKSKAKSKKINFLALIYQHWERLRIILLVIMVDNNYDTA